MVRTRSRPEAGRDDSGDVEEGIIEPVRRRGRSKAVLDNSVAPGANTSRRAMPARSSVPDAEGDDSGDVEEGIIEPVRRRGRSGAVLDNSVASGANTSRQAIGRSPSQQQKTETLSRKRPPRSLAEVAPPVLPEQSTSSQSSENNNTAESEESFEFVAPRPPVALKKVVQVKLKRVNLQQQAANVSTVSSAPSSRMSTSSLASQVSNTSVMSGRTATNARAPRGPGFTAQDKIEIDTCVRECLEESQRSNGNERNKLYTKFRKMFYKKKTIEEASDWQKYFAQNLWSTSLLFFKAPNRPPVQCALKFILKVVLTAGTPEEKQQENCNLEIHPLYYFVLKLFAQSHMDERPSVRLRVINIAAQVLEKYRTLPPIANNRTLHKQLLECLMERIKDRNSHVRAVAASLLKYYIDEDPEVLKRLKYFARFDPTPEVRKASMLSLVDVRLVKTSFFFDFVFDPDTKVRMEAFSCLATRPMVNLKPEDIAKAVLWGLNRQDACKKVVVEKLIPAWMEQCDKDPIQFIRLLGIAKKPRIVETILDGVYLNNFNETFESIDRSFLNENNVIPADKMTVESAMFWVYMIKKFGNERYTRQRLLPQADYMITYLKSIMEAIHTEHNKAREEDRDEDGTLLISLTYLISIVLKMGVEEGNRRNLIQLLTQILLDPVMDEAPLINCAVDAMKKIMDSKVFVDKMMEIFQDVFEPDKTFDAENFNQKSPHEISAVEPDALDVDVDVPIEDPDKKPDPELQPESQESAESQQDANASKRAPLPLTEKQICYLKNKLCDLQLRRLRLGEEKRKCLQDTNYLEAHRLQQEIDAVCVEENHVKDKLECSRAPSTISMMSKGSRTSRHLNDTSDMEMEIDDEVVPPPSRSKSGSSKSRGLASADQTLEGDQDMPMSQGTNAGDGDVNVGISRFKILKGIVMMNRFLSCKPKITPFVRHFYDHYAIDHFTNDYNDTRTRVELLNFLCLVGIIEGEEKRKVMGLLITALQNDLDPEIRTAAFKCMVDTLCKYPMQDFVSNESGGSPCFAAPEVFNKADATPIEIQEMFLKLIDFFGSENSGLNVPDAQSIKVSGVIKLLTAERISTEHILAEILCFWCDTTCQGTKIPYDIGTWLPIFTRLSVANARLVSKALFISVQRIISARERKINNVGLMGANYLNLVDFVGPYLSSSHLEPLNGEVVNVQEDLYAQIITHVAEHTKLSMNLDLMMILPKLNVQTEQAARSIVQEISNALIKISVMPQTSTIIALKTALKKSGKQITARFEELDEILNNAIEQAPPAQNDSDSEDSLPNAFSEDEEDEEDKENVALLD